MRSSWTLQEFRRWSRDVGMREAIALWEGEIDDKGDLVIDPINCSIDLFSTFVTDFEISAIRDLTAVY